MQNFWVILSLTHFFFMWGKLLFLFLSSEGFMTIASFWENLTSFVRSSLPGWAKTPEMPLPLDPTLITSFLIFPASPGRLPELHTVCTNTHQDSGILANPTKCPTQGSNSFLIHSLVFLPSFPDFYLELVSSSPIMRWTNALYTNKKNSLQSCKVMIASLTFCLISLLFYLILKRFISYW